MDMTELLKRTQLKGFGEFLMGNPDAAGTCLEADWTAEELLEQRRESLGMAREQGQEGERELESLEEMNRRVGFYTGLRAGARMVLELLGEGELRF